MGVIALQLALGPSHFSPSFTWHKYPVEGVVSGSPLEPGRGKARVLSGESYELRMAASAETIIARVRLRCRTMSHAHRSVDRPRQLQISFLSMISRVDVGETIAVSRRNAG